MAASTKSVHAAEGEQGGAKKQRPSSAGAPTRSSEPNKPLENGNVWVWGVAGDATSGGSDSLLPRLAANLSGKGVKGLAFGDKAAAAVTNKVSPTHHP
jgi:hypothetical protein